MAVYSFDDQLSKGERQESRLDDYFALKFFIWPATRDEQRQGIDRHYMSKATHRRFTVEYKADWTAGKTGNAFVETVSVDVTGKEGWAVTSQAQYLFYLVLNPDALYILTFSKIRNQLSNWRDIYQRRTIPNNGYHTIGILVPLEEFEKHAVKVISDI